MQRRNQQNSNYQEGGSGQANLPCRYRHKDLKQFYCDTFCDESGNIKLDFLGKLNDYMDKNPDKRSEIEAQLKKASFELGKPSQGKFCRYYCNNSQDTNDIWNQHILEYLKQENLDENDCIDTAIFEQILGQNGGEPQSEDTGFDPTLTSYFIKWATENGVDPNLPILDIYQIYADRYIEDSKSSYIDIDERQFSEGSESDSLSENMDIPTYHGFTMPVWFGKGNLDLYQQNYLIESIYRNNQLPIGTRIYHGSDQPFLSWKSRENSETYFGVDVIVAMHHATYGSNHLNYSNKHEKYNFLYEFEVIKPIKYKYLPWLSTGSEVPRDQDNKSILPGHPAAYNYCVSQGPCLHALSSDNMFRNKINPVELYLELTLPGNMLRKYLKFVRVYAFIPYVGTIKGSEDVLQLTESLKDFNPVDNIVKYSSNRKWDPLPVE